MFSTRDRPNLRIGQLTLSAVYTRFRTSTTLLSGSAASFFCLSILCRALGKKEVISWGSYHYTHSKSLNPPLQGEICYYSPRVEQFFGSWCIKLLLLLRDSKQRMRMSSDGMVNRGEHGSPPPPIPLLILPRQLPFRLAFQLSSLAIPFSNDLVCHPAIAPTNDRQRQPRPISSHTCTHPFSKQTDGMSNFP